jgi:hypothetical protein
MDRFERLGLGPAPSSTDPAPVTRMARSPGRHVELDEAATLAEKAMSTDDLELKVLSVAEVDHGWAFALQSPRYLETRSISDQVVGHGLTFVERTTGDVYSSGSAYAPEAAVLGFARALSDRTGPGQVPYNEQLRPTFDVYYDRLLRAANNERDQTARDRFWLHVLDALRLRRLVLGDPSSDNFRRAVRAVHDALDEFPLPGERGAQTRSAFDTFEHAANRAG